MLKRAERIFNQILKEAQSDPNILGLFLSGSRGKGLTSKYSDYDVIMIVKDGKSESYKNKYQYVEKIRNIDLDIQSYSEFKNYACFGGHRSMG
ncbi:MAG: nucleotidyltransferase domain-containing protein [Candidatus Heimdallarchaeota archaeon]